MINIIVADDEKDICNSIAKIIASNIKTNEIFIAHDGIEVIEITSMHHISVIVMDVAMPNKNGLETATEVLKKFPSIKIICTSLFQTFENYFTMKKIGIVGFIQKGSKPIVYKLAIETVLNDEYYFEENIVKYLEEKGLWKEKKTPNKSIEDYRLTSTQLIVLKFICSNYKNIEIANELNITTGSVEKHVHNLFEKFNTANRNDLKMHQVVRNWFMKL
jgi:DNA-binding NarL/FixJ family response regulator